MPATYSDQLASVQAAIAKVEARGQQYEVQNDGALRKNVRAELSTLYAREKYLRGMAKRETRGRLGIGVQRTASR